MDAAAFDALLRSPEGPALDWKRTLPAGLVAPLAADRDAARGEILKDVAAIANTLFIATPPPGFLVYGVRDQGSRRDVLGLSGHLDDADLQAWLGSVFDVPPPCSYSEFAFDTRPAVGILAIERPQWPVVVKSAIGPLAAGQVWYRQGTKNTLALTDQLRQLFEAKEPIRFGSLNDRKLSELMDYFRNQGLSPHLKRFTERDSLLLGGWTAAYLPGTRREIQLVDIDGRTEFVVLLRP